MTDTSLPGYYEVSFSPGAKYYVLSYRGPKVPWQRLREVAQNGGKFASLCMQRAKLIEQTILLTSCSKGMKA